MGIKFKEKKRKKSEFMIYFFRNMSNNILLGVFIKFLAGEIVVFF